ncbi:nuclear transport factor 2 family protein [Nocardia sp. NPDC050378]|uniref:nuclear transport factor 2 family protein n=1 Tax=Nocardia sp. NPDC050378 TaxID=3155400 RepID=UPI0033FCB432
MSEEFDLSAIVATLAEGRQAASPAREHMLAVMQKYIDNLNDPDPAFFSDNFSENYRYEDPVGAGVLCSAAMAERFDPRFFTIKSGELISPISMSMGNSAAMAFRVFADVDGRNISIDIVDVMTFDAAGKIADVKAYWGVENITLIDQR